MPSKGLRASSVARTTCFVRTSLMFLLVSIFAVVKRPACLQSWMASSLTSTCFSLPWLRRPVSCNALLLSQ